MRSKKTLLVISGLVLLLGCILVLRMRPRKLNTASVSDTSRGPSFEVRVDAPLSDRPPWEIPGVILGFSDRGPWFDQASPGAKVGNVAPDHLELRAEGGWEILIDADTDGRIAPGTQLAFPIELGGRPLKFKCRPSDRASGNFSTTTRAGSGELDGSFVLELTTCVNAVSGKTAAWPARPLTVRGSFAGLPPGRR